MYVPAIFVDNIKPVNTTIFIYRGAVQSALALKFEKCY